MVCEPFSDPYGEAIFRHFHSFVGHHDLSQSRWGQRPPCCWCSLLSRVRTACVVCTAGYSSYERLRRSWRPDGAGVLDAPRWASHTATYHRSYCVPALHVILVLGPENDFTLRTSMYNTVQSLRRPRDGHSSTLGLGCLCLACQRDTERYRHKLYSMVGAGLVA